MSRAEHELFDILIALVGNEYHVFPQIHLATILDHKVVGQKWKSAFRHIDEKSVDFVLCDKRYIRPLLVIELDDKTHEYKDRKDRDIEVERILSGAQIPLLRIENKGTFDKEFIATQLRNYLTFIF
jgi:very-short-patch-repair endonuclease